MAVKQPFGDNNLSCMQDKYAYLSCACPCPYKFLSFQDLQIKSPSTSGRAEEQISSDQAIMQVIYIFKLSTY